MAKKRVRITHRRSGEVIAEGPVGWGITPWLHFRATTGEETRFLGWRYVLPNPLFPFIAFRVAVRGGHPDIDIEVTPLARTRVRVRTRA